MPVKEPFNELFGDFNIFGKLVFYEQGLIFVDNKLNCFVLSYPEIEHIVFYMGDEQWMEIKTR